MEVLHTLSIGLAAVCIVGLIVWGANSCSLQEAELREACIKAGGSVITGMNGNSHCIRGSNATVGQ